MAIDDDFFCKGQVTDIAKRLLGMHLCVRDQRGSLVGKIVETEAYHESEGACHAHLGRKSSRNQIMFGPGGYAYVYLCYGIHHLFNIVTGPEGIAEAVLIRAIEPLEGIPQMLENRKIPPETKKEHSLKNIASGPGKLTQALRISLGDYGLKIGESRIRLLPGTDPQPEIEATRRIGVDYAGADAERLWRFTIKGNNYISRR